MNGKLAHECVVFGTLMPRFSCRGVACAERQSETNLQRLDVYYTRRNTTPSCRGHRPCGSKRVVSQKYAGKMVVAIAHHLVGKTVAPAAFIAAMAACVAISSLGRC
eukprot:COSAG01_NODE_7587_length_3137_cov_7.399605_2_plen_106_part_00